MGCLMRCGHRAGPHNKPTQMEKAAGAGGLGSRFPEEQPQKMDKRMRLSDVAGREGLMGDRFGIFKNAKAVFP